LVLAVLNEPERAAEFALDAAFDGRDQPAS